MDRIIEKLKEKLAELEKEELYLMAKLNYISGSKEELMKVIDIIKKEDSLCAPNVELK